MFKDNPIIECSWENTLSFFNSSQERSRARMYNRNLSVVVYPLTRNFLNSYYIERGSPFSSVYVYDCAGSMYSFFKQFFGKSLESGSGSGVPAAAVPGIASTGFFSTGLPFGLDLDNLPWWLWVLIIGGAGLYIKNKLD